MVDGKEPFQGVKKLRNEKRADIVGLVLHSPTACGLSTRVNADAEDAYFVVHHACAGITYSIAHEVGHIIGVRHDRMMDDTNAAICLRAWVHQRHQMARYDELPGRMQWMSSHTLLV